MEGCIAEPVAVVLVRRHCSPPLEALVVAQLVVHKDWYIAVPVAVAFVHIGVRGLGIVAVVFARIAVAAFHIGAVAFAHTHYNLALVAVVGCMKGIDIARPVLAAW